jgi:hypothetical protein
MKSPLYEIIFILIGILLLLTIWEACCPQSTLLTPSGMLAYLNQRPKVKTKIAVKKDTIPALPVVDTAKHRILLTGDSMVEGLMFPFIKYCKINGHHFTGIPVYSSTTLSFSKSDTLIGLIKKYDPDYIILALGSNELFIRGIEKRDSCVKKILKQAGKRKLVWIGPPNWKKDTGINDLILSNVGEKRFFLSKDLHFERARDGAHPTWASARVWADTIARWLMNPKACQYPIMMKKDTAKTVNKNAP